MPVKAIIFLLIQAILYVLILAVPAAPLAACCYLSILVCFLFALLMHRPGTKLFLVGLACTLAADYFLVVMDPIQRLWGMIFFLCAQLLYGLALHRQKPIKGLGYLRIGLSILAIVLPIAILGKNSDLLAVISVCYYANLIVNIIAAFSQREISKLLPLGFLLFLLCDTVIGLQVASSGYLSIPETSWLYRLIFSRINMAWLFYLPSQVLIVLSLMPKGELFQKFRKN